MRKGQRNRRQPEPVDSPARSPDRTLTDTWSGLLLEHVECLLPVDSLMYRPLCHQRFQKGVLIQ
jgi:hypothetical protein